MIEHTDWRDSNTTVVVGTTKTPGIRMIGTNNPSDAGKAVNIHRRISGWSTEFMLVVDNVESSDPGSRDMFSLVHIPTETGLQELRKEDTGSSKRQRDSYSRPDPFRCPRCNTYRHVFVDCHNVWPDGYMCGCPLCNTFGHEVDN